MIYSKEKIGNTIIFYDKEIRVNGKYFQIAVVSKGGNIRWLVDAQSLPEDVLNDIQNTADDVKQAFRKEFEQLTQIEQLHTAVGVCSSGTYIKLFESGDYSTAEQVHILKDIYFNKV